MSAPYQKIQIRRIKDFSQNLDTNEFAEIVPDYGEMVFSHQPNKDELVIGDGSTTLPNLPRLNFQKLYSSPRITSSSTAPPPVNGDLWVDLSDSEHPTIKVYVGNDWKPIVGVWG